MDNDLHRLIYYSRSRIGDDKAVFEGGIQNILDVSRRNNAAAGVSGALVFNAGCFGQVLEGRRTALEGTFQRIQKDSRHGEVSLLTFEPVGARTFGSWSMGYVGRRAQDVEHFAEVGRDTHFDPSAMSGDALLKALVTLARKGDSA